MNSMLRTFLGFLFTVFTLISIGQTNSYHMFDNYKPSIEANSVRCFLEDPQGLIWVGTNGGLFSFDGYNTYPHSKGLTSAKSLINCAIQISNNYLLLGSETGLLLFNIVLDEFEPFLGEFKQDVRSLIQIGDDIWIGCTEGLFIYNLSTKEIKEYLLDSKLGIKFQMTYALAEFENYVYLGANGKFGRVSLLNKKYEPLDSSKVGGSFLIHNLLKDPLRKCVWIGRGGSLIKYTPATKIFEYIGEFNVVKSMALDYNNNVVMGTDNGLCIYNESGPQFIFHDSRNPKSLVNNVIWSVYKDKSENIWLGTDNGFSFSPKYSHMNIIPIYEITGTSDGNQFHSIYKDSYNNYWLGGTNGLTMCQDNIEGSQHTSTFKMGGSQNYISHNHIREVFEDKDHTLWVATDYGLNRFNRDSKSFTRFYVNFADRKQNSNWVYDLIHDSQNRLWIATFNGGIFVIDKQKLSSNKYSAEADLNYSTTNGLSGNNVAFIVSDNDDNIWALIHNTGIDVINSVTENIQHFPIKHYTNGIIPNYMLIGSKGYIWAGFSQGIARINPSSKTVKIINFDGVDKTEVLAMTEVNNSIWVSTTNGIWIIDKVNLSSDYIPVINKTFTAIHFDKEENKVLLGGNDFIGISDPNKPTPIISNKIVISSIQINNQPYVNQTNSPTISYIEELKLPYNQNNIKIEFSNLVYSEENRAAFIYKVNDEEVWNSIASGENSIQLNKLKPGRYNISISKMSPKGVPANVMKSFLIIITPPWYTTHLAKAFYTLFIILFFLWVYFFITSKNRMKYEQIEKEKTLEQSKHKIAFFSDVAHEFKTPLSLIIAPLSRLIESTKNEKDRSALVMTHQNALKLNSLIHQAIAYYRDDSKVNIGLLLSKVELVSFLRTIFSAHEEVMKSKQIEFIFNSNIDLVSINIDTVKMESVFNNLFSNACKFSSAGDRIISTIEVDEKNNYVEIRVSDTGYGIPAKDLPYIFQRFYQSSNNTKKQEGTGIGLFLVKNYVELHGGSVAVISDVNEGTTFTITLPIISSEEKVNSIIHKLDEGKGEKPLIVIVEDNLAIAEFIYNTFIQEFRCIIANNGKTGLKTCMDLKPDIIISDVMMPVMDGLEMAKRLKKHIPTSTIPTIFLTAKDDKETELKSIELNIDAFITKPFDASILYSRVNQLLENRIIFEKKVRIEKLASPIRPQIISKDEQLLGKITKIIEDNIDDPELNVKMLCELADIPSKQLYRKIKQLTGFSTVEYIRSIRIKKAATYLSNKNFTVAEVMYMVGFSNHSYFSKCFHAEFGKTPRHFLEQTNKG